MMPGVSEEIGKTTRSFFDALKDQPLSLALVVVVLVQVAFIWYSQANVLTQRKESMDLIVSWQKETDRLMANCVSKEVTDMMLNNVQKITETMLANTQMEIARMQTAIEAERVRNQKLAEQMLELIKPRQPAPQSFESPKPIEYAECDPFGPFCMPQ